MSIPNTEKTINNETNIYLISFLITFIFLNNENNTNGIVTTLPNKNDSGLIKKLNIYTAEIRIKKIFTFASKICFNKNIKVEKLKISAVAV